ncbi:hypothetical protein [Serratia entomophila]|uniref:hypothetical protein n=1 Tax=Serratia entomophila TaxID=42906 RepID=UPI0021B70CDF|nr:hypothetical protein [Serratia entomophila]
MVDAALEDSPALIVVRVIGSLINKSVIMAESGVCRREDIDIAAVGGVNYADEDAFLAALSKVWVANDLRRAG